MSVDSERLINNKKALKIARDALKRISQGYSREASLAETALEEIERIEHTKGL